MMLAVNFTSMPRQILHVDRTQRNELVLKNLIDPIYFAQKEHVIKNLKSL